MELNRAQQEDLTARRSEEIGRKLSAIAYHSTQSKHMNNRDGIQAEVSDSEGKITKAPIWIDPPGPKREPEKGMMGKTIDAIRKLLSH